MADPASVPSATASPAMDGYKGFGSFFSDNVEEMIALPDEAWHAPPLPRSVATEPERVDSGTALGHALRDSSFFVDPSWTFVNHGAFGGALRCGVELAQRWQRYAESQPLRFIDRELFALVVHSIRTLSRVVDCSPRNLVFTPNATTGLNVAIQAAALGPEDSVFMLDIGYGSVKKMLLEVQKVTHARIITATVPLPLTTEDAFVAFVEAALPAAGCRLAIFDHVTSNTAIVLPVARLVALCRARGIPVLIDGAHALGALDLHLDALGADWYVSNCHKWFSSPRGLALLHVHPDRRAATHPVIVSHGAGSGFTSEFIWDGCRDYSAILALPVVVDWWTRLGLARARVYCRALLARAVERLTTAWGTDTHSPLSFYSHMALVRLPERVVPAEGRDGAATSAHAKFIQDCLFAAMVECPCKCIGGRLYLRISAAVYNDDVDYERVLDAVNRLAPHREPDAAEHPAAAGGGGVGVGVGGGVGGGIEGDDGGDSEGAGPGSAGEGGSV